MFIVMNCVMPNQFKEHPRMSFLRVPNLANDTDRAAGKIVKRYITLHHNSQETSYVENAKNMPMIPMKSF